MADLQDFFAKKDKKKKKTGKVTVTTEEVEAIGKTVASVGVSDTLGSTPSTDPSSTDANGTATASTDRPPADSAPASAPPADTAQATTAAGAGAPAVAAAAAGGTDAAAAGDAGTGPAPTVSSAGGTAGGKAPVTSDDGWVELEEETAHVNTGGRAIVELKRGAREDADDAQAHGEGAAGEKFQGWKKKDPEEAAAAAAAEAEEPAKEAKPLLYSARRARDPPVNTNDTRKFPSLAEAAKMPATKPSVVRPGIGAGPGSAPARTGGPDRVGASRLKAMLEESRARDAERSTSSGASRG